MDQQRIHRAHQLIHERRYKQLRDRSRCVRKCSDLWCFLVSVVVRVRGWMVQRRVPGCSYVNAHMFTFTQNPNDLNHFMIKHKCVFHKREFFDMPKNARNSSKKPHRKKLCPTKRRDPLQIEDLERLLVDWEREKNFHCNSILHLETLQNHSCN